MSGVGVEAGDGVGDGVEALEDGAEVEEVEEDFDGVGEVCDEEVAAGFFEVFEEGDEGAEAHAVDYFNVAEVEDGDGFVMVF